MGAPAESVIVVIEGMSPPSTPGEVSWAPSMAWLDSSPRPPTSGNVIPATRIPAITVTASSRTFAVIDPRPAQFGQCTAAPSGRSMSQCPRCARKHP